MRPEHWFFKKSDRLWEPYSDHASDCIEIAAQSSVEQVPLQVPTEDEN